MKLKVNDKEVESQATFLHELSQELNLPSTGIAVAVNQCMIPRMDWENHALHDGDTILIIKAVCGG